MTTETGQEVAQADVDAATFDAALAQAQKAWAVLVAALAQISDPLQAAEAATLQALPALDEMRAGLRKARTAVIRQAVMQGWTQTEVGRRLGITRGRIDQMVSDRPIAPMRAVTDVQVKGGKKFHVLSCGHTYEWDKDRLKRSCSQCREGAST